MHVMRIRTWLPFLAVLALAALLSACGGDDDAPAEPAPDDGSAVEATAEPEEEPAAENALLFLADDLRVGEGGCTQISWETTNAARTYLDGEGVSETGVREVCPDGTTSYELRVVYADGSEKTSLVEVEVDLPEATEAPTEAPTAVPATAVPVTQAPAPTAEPTAEPTAAESVSFYPDNGVYELDEDQTCTAVNWETTGVTDVQLERVGSGRDPRGPSGREEACFGEDEVTYILWYKRADGSEASQEITLRRK